MAKYELFFEEKFKKDWKVLSKKHYDYSKLEKIIELLIEGEKLPAKYKEHSLQGEWKGFKECHIENDWLLIYYVSDLKIVLVRTGSHEDLFR